MTTDTADRTIDVREIDGPPFGDIAAALSDVEGDDRLRIVAPFEPVPLYDVLEGRGFDYETDRRDDVWHVLVERE